LRSRKRKSLRNEINRMKNLSLDYKAVDGEMLDARIKHERLQCIRVGLGTA
jgi:hypothetical protein